ncbi:hypothetical protein, partial [Klebsiella pneumoniae]|uniref:hypothetical protein n=1 Tax=Klebsiella pneumoniae TaxID=573 RepID=UPI0030135CC9
MTFDVDAPLKERIFSFSRESILRLKAKINNKKWNSCSNEGIDAAELMGKQRNEPINGKITSIIENWLGKKTETETESPNSMVEISSFQSLCA